jgi:hypothetical protein
MKILLINNYHYSRDGVTRAYFDMAEILTAHGHEVAFFFRAKRKIIAD